MTKGMELKKQLARHDTDFAINPGSNHETSIKLSADIVSLFIDIEADIDTVSVSNDGDGIIIDLGGLLG